MFQDAFWKGKKVLVTGHTGFKGAWLTVLLKQLGAEPVGYSLPAPTNPSLYELLNLSEGLVECIDDIRNEKAFTSFVKSQSPEIVIHMAAQPLVRLSYSEPVETISTNVLGTAHVLNALRNVDSVKSIVVVTTDKCYENFESSIAYKESDRLGGKDPYSASKAATEIVTKSFYYSFFKDTHCGLATARAGNVIGGGDFASDRLIPDIIRALKAGTHIELRSPGSVRPWQHVIEPLIGYLMLARSLYDEPNTFSEAFNFGPNLESCVSVGKMLELMKPHMKISLPVEMGNEGSMKESKLLMLDNSKSRATLGWTPVWSIEQTIEKTFIWYNAFLEDKDLKTITLDQIQSYLEP